jgi:hypothetical protein
MTIDRFSEILSALGNPFAEREIAEIFWLACQIGVRQEGSLAGATSELKEDTAIDFPPAVASADETSRRKPIEIRRRPQIPESSDKSLEGSELHAEIAFGGRGFDAREVLVPTAPMVHGELEFLRALRPLKRRFPSHSIGVIDEDATARRIADQPRRHLWVPVMRASDEPWLTLALVMDTGASMRIWRPLIRELQELFTRLGAFRSFRIWYLSGQGISGTQFGASLNPAVMTDPSGRQVTLVVSDCSGTHWWDGRALRALNLWAQHGPTAILQPLSERLWRRTAAPTIPGIARMQRPGAPNTEMLFTPYETGPGDGVPVPVLEISPGWLADWSRLVTSQSGKGLSTAIAYISPTPPRSEPVRREHELPVTERVRRFRASASP